MKVNKEVAKVFKYLEYSLQLATVSPDNVHQAAGADRSWRLHFLGDLCV